VKGSHVSTTRVVVVAYHGADALATCLGSVPPGLEITVVDNSSSDDVHRVASARGASYVNPGRNLGFAAGVNLALRRFGRLPSHDVLLLNPDATLADGCLEKLFDFLHGTDGTNVGAVSPRLFDASGHEERVAWPFPSPGRAWAEAAGLGRRRSGGAFVIGAVLLLRGEALADVGLFDERFFLYAEETDWQRRAYSRGWSSAVCATATATHQGAGTSTDPLRREALFHAAHETYMRKWYGAGGWAAYRCAACLGAAGRALLLKGDRRAAAAMRARIYLCGPRRFASLAN